MNVKAFQFNPFMQNTYLVYDETGEAVVIDPGCYFPEEQKVFSEYLSKHSLTLKKVLYTHCHLDHAFGARYIANTYKTVTFYAHKDEQMFIDDAVQHAAMYGLKMEQPPMLDGFIADGEKISFGKTSLTAIHVEGHSKGGICFYVEADKTLFSGDVLFHRSIGRSDFPGGNHEALIKGIKSKLLTLPEDVVVCPGHGDYSLIGNEKAQNPFLQ